MNHAGYFDQSIGNARLPSISQVRTQLPPSNWEAELRRIPILSFVLYPQVFLLFCLLSQMAAMNFDMPLISGLAIRGRWISLAFFALIGFIGWFSVSDRTTPKLMVIFGVFLAVCGISTVYSFDPEYTFQRFGSLVLLFFAVMVGVWSASRSTKHLIAMTDMLWLLGSALVVSGFLFRGSGLDQEESGRFTGLYTRATGAGTYAALFLPLALFHARYRFSGFGKVFAWMVVALFLIQPVLASARAALVVSLGVAVVLGFFYYGSRALIGLIAAALFLPVPFLLDSKLIDKVQARAEKVVRAESLTTLTGRLDRWVWGVEKFLQKPLTGHGLGASRYLAGREEPQRFGITPNSVFILHSDQVELLMDVGVLGMTWFGLFWLGILWTMFRVATRPNSLLKAMALAYAGSVGYALVDTFMHGAFMSAGGGTSSFTWTFLAGFLAITQYLFQPARRTQSNSSQSARISHDADQQAETTQRLQMLYQELNDDVGEHNDDAVPDRAQSEMDALTDDRMLAWNDVSMEESQPKMAIYETGDEPCEEILDEPNRFERVRKLPSIKSIKQ